MQRLLVYFVAGVSIAAAQDPLGYSIATPRPINPAANTTTPSARAAQGQNPYLGSAPAPVTDAALTISLADAIQRGLSYNLGLIENVQGSAEARARRLRALSALLPSITAHASQNFDRLSLQEIGIKLPPIPGFPGLPATTGNFRFEDARVQVNQSIYNRQLRDSYRSEQASETASIANMKDARDVVVLAAGAAWFQVAASKARVDAATAQVASARELDQQTGDRVKSEVSPEIDSLRARVERQTAEQRLTNATNDLEKDKLALARIIGLSVDQVFTVADPAAYVPLTGVTQGSARAEALRSRSDLASAEASVKAAEFRVRSERAARYPTASVTAEYGAGGTSFAGPSQVYQVAASVSVPIYTGGRIRADIDAAAADLARREAELDDLQGRIAYDVRIAWLDVQASESAIAVAQSNRQLAQQALTQAQDRYNNGVTNYLEVVQAQEALAAANENYIASLYSSNVARLSLARAMGTAETRATEFFGR